MERPVWSPGTPFPIECAIYNWLQHLLSLQTSAARHAYLDRARRLHGPEIAQRLQELGEEEWRTRGGRF